MKVVLRSVLCLWLGTAVWSLSAPPRVFAQDSQKRAGARRAQETRARKVRPRAKVVRKSQRTQRPRPGKKTAPRPPTAAQAAQEAASGVDAEIVKEGQTTVKVMKFTGLGIEGRLKSPQLVYFEQRVHAEFERPTLPHRSFLPELAETTQREPVR